MSIVNAKSMSCEETCAEICACTYTFVYNSTLNFIKLYDDECKMLRQEIINHEEKEPFKLFKKAYKIWENERKDLDLKYEKALNNLMTEYSELENMLEMIN